MCDVPAILPQSNGSSMLRALRCCSGGNRSFRAAPCLGSRGQIAVDARCGWHKELLLSLLVHVLFVHARSTSAHRWWEEGWVGTSKTCHAIPCLVTAANKNKTSAWATWALLRGSQRIREHAPHMHHRRNTMDTRPKLKLWTAKCRWPRKERRTFSCLTPQSQGLYDMLNSFSCWCLMSLQCLGFEPFLALIKFKAHVPTCCTSGCGTRHLSLLEEGSRPHISRKSGVLNLVLAMLWIVLWI